MTIATTKALLSEAGSILGYNSWKIHTARYNGCSFISMGFTDSSLENTPLIQDGLDAIATTNALFGINTTKTQDANDRTLLYQTFLKALDFTDRPIIPQIVIKQLPNANRCNIELMGTGGQQFKVNAIFLGKDYQKALYNLQNAINNPPTDPEIRYVFEHPIYGKIQNTHLEDISINHNLALWNGCVVNMTLRSEEAKTDKFGKISTAELIFRALQTALSLVADILYTYQVLKALVLSFTSGLGGAKKVSATKYTQTVKTQEQVDNVANTLKQAVNFIYKKGDTGTVNTELDATPINNTYIPTALQYSVKYNATQGAIIIENYASEVNKLKDNLVLNYGGNANNLINILNKSVAELYILAENVARPQITRSYLVPFDMSIRRVLAYNNIPLDNAEQVILNNPQIKSANLIPQNTLINF